MRFTTLAPSLHTDDVPAVARFYVDLLGFDTALDIGWFVALRHPDHPGIELCVVASDHAVAPELAGPVAGLVLAFLVEDVDAEFARLSAAGVQFAVPPRNEPWGQRRCVALDPAGVGVELVQPAAPDPAWLAAQGIG